MNTLDGLEFVMCERRYSWNTHFILVDYNMLCLRNALSPNALERASQQEMENRDEP